MTGMTDYPTVDRVIADLKRLSAGFWHTDREREIGNVMVDARHCLEQLLAEVSALNQEASDKFWDVVEEGGDGPLPVAWALIGQDSKIRVMSPGRDGVAEEAKPDERLVPLYHTPFLTDRERVAVMWAVASLETDPETDAGQNKEAAEILGEMLLRTAAPINRKPQ
jgi:hypothetical protein